MTKDIINKIYTSKKYGDFIVLNKTNKKLYSNYLYEIQFINTQYKMSTTKDKILKGDLKDRYSKSIYDQGYIGNTTTRENNKSKKSYINTCKFVKGEENISEVNKRRGKTTLNGKIVFEAIHIDGRKVIGCGINKFAKEYGLDASTISNCLNGIRKKHKGWSFKRIN